MVQSPKRRRRIMVRLRKNRPAALLARARRLYEKTRTPVNDIARMLDIDPASLYRRIARYGWVKRTENPALQPARSGRGARKSAAALTSAQSAVEGDRPTAADDSGQIARTETDIARARTITARLHALALRHATHAAAAERAFAKRPGPKLLRERLAHARLKQSLDHSRRALTEIMEGLAAPERDATLR